MRRRKAIHKLVATLASGFSYNLAGGSEKKFILRELLPQQGSAGIIWSLEAGTVTHFLAGSLHALRVGDHPLPSRYMQAYRQCEQVFFEASPLDGNKPRQKIAFFEQALLQNRGGLRTLLPAGSWERMMAFLDRNRLPLDDISRAKPWYAAIRLREKALQASGFQKHLGVENQFYRKAVAEGKALGGLSSFEDQIARSSSMNHDEQLQELINLINGLEHLGEVAKGITDAWKLGKRDELERMLIPSSDVIKTNQFWCPRLEHVLQGTNQSTFILIGTAHFMGLQGVQRLIV